MHRQKSWKPTVLLERFFTPTNESLSGERSKARFKNYNLPILQFMYHGNPLTPLRCCVSDAPGWIDRDFYITKSHKQRFNIDFNHIRQEQNGLKQAGVSKDKTITPSDIFRTKYLDQNPKALIEFVTIIPLSQEEHSYITQDSALGHITLQNFNKEHWPWILQSEDNYNKFFETYNIKMNKYDYNWMIDHLSNIDHPPISQRIQFL